MIKFIVYLSIFCWAFSIKAQQNLILNANLENAISIPNNLTYYDFCNDWWRPNNFTTDYFTTLTNSVNPNFVPNNYFGHQNAINGNYYLGLILVVWQYSIDDFSNFRVEYAAGRFSKKLEKDKIYQFEYWISKADKGILKSNAIDLILTYDTLLDVNNYEPYGYKIWSEEIPMEDTVNWIKITSCFKAKGNEKAFAIGNFHSESEVIKIVGYDSTTSGEIDYRYLDNFSLIECPSCCPEQFNDEPLVYVFSNPSTLNSPASLEMWLHPNTTSVLELYDSAGRKVANETYSNLQNTFSLKRFAKGMYHFFYQTSDGVSESGKVVVAE
jgi:hypothetical protein